MAASNLEKDALSPTFKLVWETMGMKADPRDSLVPIALGVMAEPASDSSNDTHSYANPHEIRVRHVDLDLYVSFETRSLSGTATLHLEPVSPGANRVVVDTRDLTIKAVEASDGGDRFSPTPYEQGERDPILGSSLVVGVPDSTSVIRIRYATSSEAYGLQWLEPGQTAGKKHPFLYTQSQAIHARSWIPLQDTPGVRVTYEAVIRTPKSLRAVMSAEALPSGDEGARALFRFRMPQAIPPYLIALAVGDLVFEPMSNRTGIWAEPSVARRAAQEFEDTESMIQAVEKLYGRYPWGRYDLLVLPPSFPFGGMENPRLTFATSTVLVGDKSLVSLVAHELAHSWSGNLVSNATWRDFWLNEGLTVYLESRIQEAVFGAERATIEVALEVRQLLEELEDLQPRDQILHIDLEGRDPDEAFTSVPYIKGMLLLRSLEEAVGRKVFDEFLRGYFERFAFQSITTSDFLSYLEQNLVLSHPDVVEQVPIHEWVFEPGLPDGYPNPSSAALAAVRRQAQEWAAGDRTAREVSTGGWTTQHWLHFLRSLPPRLGKERLGELEWAFRLTEHANAEIRFQWLLVSIRNDYEPACQALERFLTTVGRLKFLKPLYKELVKTKQGKQRAKAIFAKGASAYHPIAAATVEHLLASK